MIHLIDFQNMAYRYASAMHLTSKVSGVVIDTSVLYGLVKYVKSIQAPTIFCLEGYPKLFRSYLPEYKGTRNKEASENNTVPTHELIATALFAAECYGKDVQFAFAPNCEADQTVASLVEATFNPRLTVFQPYRPEEDFYWKRYRKLDQSQIRMPKSEEVLIKTTDSDMYQLIRPGVKIANQLSDNVGTTATPKAVDFVEPSEIPVRKAFLGDSSDNVPAILNKDFDIKRFWRILHDILPTLQDLRQFIRSTELNQKVQGAEDLQLYITKNNKLKALKINQEVTTLRFFSMPWAVTVPSNYDVLSVIEKYKLRI